MTQFCPIKFIPNVEYPVGFHIILKGALRSNFNLFTATRNKIVFKKNYEADFKTLRLPHCKILHFFLSLLVAILPFFKLFLN